MNWWNDLENISRLLRWLHERDLMDEDLGWILHFLEKPWHWTTEYEHMLAGTEMPEEMPEERGDDYEYAQG